MKIKIRFYYDATLPELPEIFKKLEELGGRGTLVSRVERKSLTEKEEDLILDKIRKIKPQARGSIVTSGGKMLPLSGSKKLNLGNTPVILVETSAPIYVFPCRSGEKYYSLLEGLDFLKTNLPRLPELPAEIEESLANLISNNPGLLEEGLQLVSRELDTSTGKYDLLLTDKDGVPLLIEVERLLTDQALGQILRLCAGYERDNNLERIRGAIVCLRAKETVLLGARRAGIEVFTIDPSGMTARKL
ncbi:MAG: endonuclease NucS domain-containing protein [Nitrososphaerales archaeon]